MSETRKIAAILVSDVVGYSRLAGADEEGTLATLRALRADLIEPTVAAHHGRFVKSTGDGALVEFRSVVDSVRCAVGMQTGVAERNAHVPRERRIKLRIGIHLGDVVEESDGDLMGDGVNIAARLEGISRPGAICLSEDAYRQVRARLDLNATDLGKTHLKNIAEPIRAYSLEVGKARLVRHSRRFAVAASLAALIALSSGILWLSAGGQAPAPPAVARAADASTVQTEAPSPAPTEIASPAPAVHGLLRNPGNAGLLRRVRNSPTLDPAPTKAPAPRQAMPASALSVARFGDSPCHLNEGGCRRGPDGLPAAGAAVSPPAPVLAVVSSGGRVCHFNEGSCRRVHELSGASMAATAASPTFDGQSP